jgi:hypothetical protein
MKTTAPNQPLAAHPAIAKLPATKLPYGISNFVELIMKGYVYIDKTPFIELLENELNPYQLFIRPRKFGKSLFFTMLSCYYDVNYADKFETLFKGLYIGEHLKDGAKWVVSRIFLTGISPVMTNDLTSGFNIADNLTLEERYNEMLGFTSDEVDTLINASGIDRKLITVDMEYYYNGYLFSEDAETHFCLKCHTSGCGN